MKFSQILTILSIAAIAIAAPVVEERGKRLSIVNEQTCNANKNKPVAACCPTTALAIGCPTLPLGQTSMTCNIGFAPACCSTNGATQSNNNDQSANGNHDSTIVQGNFQSIVNCDSSTNSG